MRALQEGTIATAALPYAVATVVPIPVQAPTPAPMPVVPDASRCLARSSEIAPSRAQSAAGCATTPVAGIQATAGSYSIQDDPNPNTPSTPTPVPGSVQAPLAYARLSARPSSIMALDGARAARNSKIASVTASAAPACAGSDAHRQLAQTPTATLPDAAQSDARVPSARALSSATARRRRRRTRALVTTEPYSPRRSPSTPRIFAKTRATSQPATPTDPLLSVGRSLQVIPHSPARSAPQPDATPRPETRPLTAWGNWCSIERYYHNKTRLARGCPHGRSTRRPQRRTPALSHKATSPPIVA